MELRAGMKKPEGMADMVKTVADKLKDCLILAGATNQQINEIRRNNFKPNLPTHLKRISKETHKETKELFGDDIKEKLAEIEVENKLREQFTKKNTTSSGKEKASSTKGDYRYKPYEKKDEESSRNSSNYKTSQKPRGGRSSGQYKSNNSQERKGNNKGSGNYANKNNNNSNKNNSTKKQKH